MNHALRDEQEKYNALLNLFAHELRAPLTSLQALTQIALRKEQHNGDPSGKVLLEKIGDQTGRLGKLVNEMLDVTRLQSGKLTLNRSAVDFNSFLHEVAQVSLSVFPAHPVKLDSTPVSVEMDRSRISQVIMVLLGSLVKYLPDAEGAAIRTAVHNDILVVILTPEGRDVPVGDMQALEESFTDIDRMDRNDVAGMGIGLYIASQIIKLHNGSICFRKQRAYGIDFLFTLPVT